MKSIFLTLALYVAGGWVAAVPAQPDGFVRADGTGLLRDGKPFRAIGFNQPNLFSSLLLDGDQGRTRSWAAIKDATRADVRFLRFWASGFWPCDMKLYFENPRAYWALMDELFAFARQERIMLIPSIFFHEYLWPDLCDEPRGAIANVQSKTYAAMRTYATELVSRYKDDPNVLLWELGNEYFLSADLNAAMNPSASGAGAHHLGTRPRRTTDDSLTTDMLKTFYTHMAKHVRIMAPNHLVTSGDAGPRNCSRSLRESFPANVFKEDDLPDHIESLRQSQPAPLDVISLHYYGNLTGAFPEGARAESVGGISTRSLDLLTYLARAVVKDNKPLLVGELGQHDPRMIEDPDTLFVRKAIDLLEKEGAALIAIWAWHFPFHPKENVTSADYPALLQRVREFNRRYAPSP